MSAEPRHLAKPLGGEKQEGAPPETFCAQPETRDDFFYFFARNALKSPDSDE
jgi:hypothetical protein